MKKLLICLFSAGVLAACSSNNEPRKSSTLVLDNCSDAKALVKSNHQKIEQAFADNDANTIGTLELQNRSIIRNNISCFPNIEKNIKYWKKLHKEEEM